MIYMIAYKQLEPQLQRVLGRDIRCIVMDYPLEVGQEFTNQTFSDLESITLICGTDVRSKLLLLRLANNFHNPIYIIELKGKYTHISPLAVSDNELSTCCDNAHLLNNNLRAELIEEYKNLPNSRYRRIHQGKIYPLRESEIDEFIIQQIRKPVDMKWAVGVCMGHAPFGWPITDTFYYNQICRLQKSGKLKVLLSGSLQ